MVERRWADELRVAAAQLEAAGVPGAMGDARRILSHVLELAPGRLTLHLQDDVDADTAARFAVLIARRAAREPVSHLTGQRDFYGRMFEVSGDVLDPRPETETLVAAALEAPFSRVLDLGTGSGAILLTLLAERPQAIGTGTDLSPHALEVAERNAEALSVADRAVLVQSDWFSRVEGVFDLIVSNPPYIAAGEMADLAPELRHEPRMALTDEADGLSAYRVIAGGAGGHLAAGGRLMVEIGWRQGAAVAGLLRAVGFDGVRILPDLDGRDRVVSGVWPGKTGDCGPESTEKR